MREKDSRCEIGYYCYQRLAILSIVGAETPSFLKVTNMNNTANQTKPTLSLRLFFGLLRVDASGDVSVFAAVIVYGMALAYRLFG
ncbi:hypothetical protein ACTHQZ_08125 [Methylorubrum thiocyanatum]